ncbi:MAG: TonB-dependent receptor plug domain-containing protein, partial [bacterium]
MQSVFVYLIAVFCALLPASVLAEEETEPVSPEVETLVVTGSRAPQPLELVPGSVEVITRAEIEASKYDGVVDVIRNLPGLHVQQAGTRGSLASIYMRGLDPNHTLILLDGVMLNDPTNARGGSFDLSTLDVLGLEQIEVVRGPVSAVHGSDALAGAIQIRTLGGKGKDEARVDLSGGRFGYFRGMASARGTRGPVDLAIAGSWVREGVP